MQMMMRARAGTTAESFPTEPILIEPAIPGSALRGYDVRGYEGIPHSRRRHSAFQTRHERCENERTNERMCIPELPDDLLGCGGTRRYQRGYRPGPDAPGTARTFAPSFSAMRSPSRCLPGKALPLYDNPQPHRFLMMLQTTADFRTTRIYVQDKYICAARGQTGVVHTSMEVVLYGDICN